MDTVVRRLAICLHSAWESNPGSLSHEPSMLTTGLQRTVVYVYKYREAGSTSFEEFFLTMMLQKDLIIASLTWFHVGLKNTITTAHHTAINKVVH